MGQHYMDEGWLTLPLMPNSKIPATTQGWKDGELGYNIPEHYNVGVVCGPDSGLVVLDVDPRNGGDKSWLELVNEFPYLEDTYTVETPGGGLHAYFEYPAFEDNKRLISEPWKGIDFKFKGYVVAPPSRIGDRGYLHIRGETGRLGTLGHRLLAGCYKPDYEGSTTVVDYEGSRPGDWFNRETTWDEILEPHGWTRTGYNADGVEEWARPGREGGRSGTVNYLDGDTFHCFTSGSDFDSDTGYTRFTAFAILNHGGDFSEAARWVADNMMEEYEVVTNREGAVREWVPPSRSYTYLNPFEDGSFMDRYVKFGDKQTDAAHHYHEAAGLIALSMVTPLATGQLAHQRLRSNLYLVLVGFTTRSRKSTCQRILTDLLDGVAGGSQLGNRNTTEALIGDLSRRAGRASLWAPDEIGVMLGEIRSRDFLKGLEELLLTLYAGDDYVYVKADDRIVVKDPHLNILGASTPDSLARGGPNMMYGGLLPRFGVVFPEAMREPRPAGNAPDLKDDIEWLITHLRKVISFSQASPVVVWDNQALGLLNLEEQEYTTAGIHAQRLPTMLYKVSMLLALSDLTSTVTIKHADAATKVVQHWREGANNILPYLRAKSGDLEFQRLCETVMGELQDGPMFRHGIARLLNTDRAGVDRIQAALVDRNVIKVETDADTSATYWKVVS